MMYKLNEKNFCANEKSKEKSFASKFFEINSSNEKSIKKSFDDQFIVQSNIM